MSDQHPSPGAQMFGLAAQHVAKSVLDAMRESKSPDSYMVILFHPSCAVFGSAAQQIEKLAAARDRKPLHLEDGSMTLMLPREAALQTLRTAGYGEVSDQAERDRSQYMQVVTLHADGSELFEVVIEAVDPSAAHFMSADGSTRMDVAIAALGIRPDLAAMAVEGALALGARLGELVYLQIEKDCPIAHALRSALEKAPQLPAFGGVPKVQVEDDAFASLVSREVLAEVLDQSMPPGRALPMESVPSDFVLFAHMTAKGCSITAARFVPRIAETNARGGSA